MALFLCVSVSRSIYGCPNETKIVVAGTKISIVSMIRDSCKYVKNWWWIGSVLLAKDKYVNLCGKVPPVQLGNNGLITPEIPGNGRVEYKWVTRVSPATTGKLL